MNDTIETETSDTVQPEFTREQAKALLSYTSTSLSGDDSFDEFRENVVDARDELERSLQSDTDHSEDP
ncbi:hypothetical protein [Natrinema pallidum]|uniref:Uncharacterized protein n=1 Tax=Natrinema pallidum TaxID=69527 RepID=A0A4P9TJW6_9EURY|nr:hypothetical protein [Natrinema pallidum]QCW05269.1 hypothetical protein FGF80_18675 [Natrinema pallidum]